MKLGFKIPITKIEKPYVIVKLHEDVLEVDLKEGAKKELEEVTVNVKEHGIRGWLKEHG